MSEPICWYQVVITKLSPLWHCQNVITKLSLPTFLGFLWNSHFLLKILPPGACFSLKRILSWGGWLEINDLKPITDPKSITENNAKKYHPFFLISFRQFLLEQKNECILNKKKTELSKTFRDLKSFGNITVNPANNFKVLVHKSLF